MKKFLAALAISCLPAFALAQSPPSNPAMTYGYVPSVGVWNSWFMQKQDALGFTPLNRAGDSMLGRLTLSASTNVAAGLNIGQGIAPGAPVNGDMWLTPSGLYFQVNGSVIGPITATTGVGCAALPAFTGAITSAGGTCATVLGSGVALVPTNNLSDVASSVAALANLGGLSSINASTTYAPLASPALTGTPTTPTGTPGTNTTQIASQAYVGVAVAASNVLRSYIAGYTLANDGGSPNTVLDIAAGEATDSTNAAMISNTAFTKSTAGPWASGSGANAMGNGLTITASTWYHVCLANNGGTPDYWFDTSASCANKPTGITDAKFRRIGSFHTSAGTNIQGFVQNGNEFLWAVAVQDVSTSSLGTTSSTLSLPSVPPGVKVNALYNAIFSNAAVANAVISSLDQTDVAADSPAGNRSIENIVAGLSGQATLNTRTNTSQQIRARASAASSTLQIVTYGWIDSRGQNN